MSSPKPIYLPADIFETVRGDDFGTSADRPVKRARTDSFLSLEQTLGQIFPSFSARAPGPKLILPRPPLKSILKRSSSPAIPCSSSSSSSSSSPSSSYSTTTCTSPTHSPSPRTVRFADPSPPTTTHSVAYWITQTWDMSTFSQTVLAAQYARQNNNLEDDPAPDRLAGKDIPEVNWPSHEARVRKGVFAGLREMRGMGKQSWPGVRRVGEEDGEEEENSDKEWDEDDVDDDEMDWEYEPQPEPEPEPIPSERWFLFDPEGVCCMVTLVMRFEDTGQMIVKVERGDGGLDLFGWSEFGRLEDMSTNTKSRRG